MLTGKMFRDGVISAANHISNNRKSVDALNIFPVPDGDTGTNMSMTIGAAAKEMAVLPDSCSIGEAASKCASALLRGARGNSGVILSLIGILFIRPISYLLGATDAMIEDCVIYGRVVLSFNTAFMLQNVFQTFLAAAEKPKLGLWITTAAGITNILLDALFIAVFQWGVGGAALATGIGQCVGGILPLIYFIIKCCYY